MDSMIKEMDFARDIEDINQIPAVAKILEVICSTTGMGFATVARVTEDRWIACAVHDNINFGLEAGGELEVQTTLCHQVMRLRENVAIDHVDQDPVYADHNTPKMYGLQSYISIPVILKNGDYFGTLCAIDPQPALVNNEKTITMFNLFAELIAFNLDSLHNLTDAQTKLQEERKTAETREQFIAILGHDLRNPVNAISMAAELMFRSNALDERNLKMAKIILNSNNRTKELIDNMLDLARGRLGGGIKLNFENTLGFEEILNQVVNELRLTYPDRLIVTDFKLTQVVIADYKRIAQLFSNLLGNALLHGDSESPVIVSAETHEDRFELCVINKGPQISSETQEHLFKPFSRGKVHYGQEGLGLGLFIASEIAKAHQGKITVRSTEEETCFILEIPS